MVLVNEGIALKQNFADVSNLFPVFEADETHMSEFIVPILIKWNRSCYVMPVLDGCHPSPHPQNPM